MIEVKNLCKHYGQKRAVDRISFSVRRGDVLGFLGPNGAGKSTTMKMLTGFLRPDAGTAVVNGHDVVQDSLAVRRSLGYLAESAPAYPEMTVAEFLDFIAEMRGYRHRQEKSRRVWRVVEMCHLQSVMGQTIETLSKGYKQRVGFAQALLHDPPVLVLDEPTDGLDPNQKIEVRSIIRQLAAEKTTILSTHILEEVEAICNRVIIIAQGQVVVDETPAELRVRQPGARLDEIFHALTASDRCSP
jgi:ABC-2 type transport system ATP-binding protein